MRAYDIAITRAIGIISTRGGIIDHQQSNGTDRVDIVSTMPLSISIGMIEALTTENCRVTNFFAGWRLMKVESSKFEVDSIEMIKEVHV